MPRVFQPVPKTVEITVQGQRDNQLIENKFYAQGVSAITEAMVAALASIVDSWVASSFLANLPDNYQYLRTIARDLSSEASFEVINHTNGGAVGAITGDYLPNNVSVAVHRDTGLSGKKAKSRIYWPGISDVQQGGANTLSTTAAASFISSLNDLLSLIQANTSNTWTYGYVQRVLNGVKLSIGNFVAVFGHSLTDLILDSMRDRLPGHGV